MFRYVLTLLLINSCYRSLGGPVPAPKPVSTLLKELAESCHDQFLVKHITSAIDECPPQDPHKEVKCLLFFDIANRLCLASNTSQITIKEYYTGEINKDQTVEALCSESKNWVLTNMTGYNYYTSKLIQVRCPDFCAVDDLLSLNANFFCKFYKWGDEFLKNQPHIKANEIAADAGGLDSKQNKDSLDINASPVANEIPKSITNEMPPVVSSSSVSNQINPSQNSPPPNVPQPNKDPANQSPVQENQAQPAKNEIAEPKLDEPVLAKLQPNVESDVHAQIPKNVPIAPIVEKVGKHEEPKPNGLDESNGNLPDDIDDYAGNEDSEGLKNDPDVADNVDDPKFEDDKQQKENQVDNKNKIKVVPVVQNTNDHVQKVKEENEEFDEIKNDEKLEPAMPSLDKSSHREFYSSSIEDPEDDHFFTFFLTAVILVVVIYVLYYNKNKVGKLVLGLIVEGRQGRRRNSRGHAYRRLDTLEQAMNSNTTAPPSKIIY